MALSYTAGEKQKVLIDLNTVQKKMSECDVSVCLAIYSLIYHQSLFTDISIYLWCITPSQLTISTIIQPSISPFTIKPDALFSRFLI